MNNITRFSRVNQGGLKVIRYVPVQCGLRQAKSGHCQAQEDIVQRHQIDPARTVMIVVDMENDFVAAGAPMETPAARAMVPMLAKSLEACRGAGVRVIYTTHVHRPDGSDLGNFKELDARIATHQALVDGTPGIDIYPDLAPAPGEHVIKKHRYSAFFGTDLDIILREWQIDTVIISGTTTENCCLSTARDALFRNYDVLFLSDATATYDYPDRGYGAMPNAEIHHATLVVLACSTATVMTVAEMIENLPDRASASSRAA
jgi:nicotinamidase-related amidase